MTDIVVGIKFRADGKGLVSEAKSTTKEIDKFERELSQTDRTAKRTSKSLLQTDVATGRLGKRMHSTLAPMKLMRAGLAGLVAVMGISQFIRYSDTMTNLNNQLKLVTSSQKELIATQSALLALANDTRSPLTSTTELYAKLFRATRELNVSQSQLLAVTKAVNQSFVISGASTQETQGSIRQLAQALASGAFRGDEFNSVAEQAPRLMQALSAETGKTTGELRKLAAEGKLTSEVLVRALVNQADAIDKEYQSTNATIGQASTVLGNNLMSLLGTFNETTNASGGVADAILAIANGFGEINTILASGQLSGYLDAIADNWTVNVGDMSGGLDYLVDAFKQYFHFMIDGYKAIGKALLTFPQHVKFMAQSVIEQLSYLVTVGKEYSKTFSKVIEAELTELNARVAVIVRELADQMQFWDGDNYNATEAMAAASEVAEGMTAEILKARDAQIQAAKASRDAAIQGFEDERTASIALFDLKIAQATQLGQLHKQAANDASSGNNVIQGDFGQIDDTGGDKNNVTDSQVTRLRESLLTQEEALTYHYEKRQLLLNDALVQQKISEDDFQALSLKSHQKYMDDKQAYSAAKNNLILNGAQQIFGSLAGLAETFGGKQSKAYKVMFAVQKGFAIAQGVLNVATAVTNAFALPFPTNIPAVGAAITQGANLMTQIKGATYKGQAHDGVRRMTAANEGTYVVRRDEMVMNPKQRENFEKVVEATDTKQGSFARNVVHLNPVFHIDASNAMPGVEERIRETVTDAITLYDETLQNDFANNGHRSQTLSGRVA